MKDYLVECAVCAENGTRTLVPLHELLYHYALHGLRRIEYDREFTVEYD